MAAKKLNIAKAIKRPGALTAKAKKAGQSPMQFASKHAGDSGLTGQQSRFAKQLAGFRKGKK
jgi:hypothetical protein